MRQLSSRCTGHFGIFTLTSQLAAGRRGSTAVIISRPCWYRSGERRNAENLSETVPGSARGMAAVSHRFSLGR